jgi:hypothetical protein
MDRRRLADIRAGTPAETRSGGTGYLVGKRLVLTCRHVVLDADRQPWPRVQVRLGHPGDGPQHCITAFVVWVHPDRGSDAALLKIDDAPFTARNPVRWGWFAGSMPVSYTGLGYPIFSNYESGRGVEQLDGMLPPLALGIDGAYVLNQRSAPEAAAGRAWPGMSGAAVFCHGLLAAVVTRDDLQFGNRRLYAVPAYALTADPEFARLVAEDSGSAPVLEAVELADYLQQPGNAVLPGTPGSLLAAAVEAVDFTGRQAELQKLTRWRDGPQPFSIMLVTGEGGQGKTRLARELSANARRAGWAAGFLAAHTSGAVRDDSDYRQATARLALLVGAATRPVLLVADYAETRPEEVAALANAMLSRPPVQAVRLLLLSRTAGAWWTSFTDVPGLDTTQRIDLTPLTDTGEVRRDAYIAAVAGLARHLAALPDAPATLEPGQSWSGLAEHLAQQSPILDDPRLGNALTLQMTALTDLLATAANEELVRLGASEERELIRHERGYLRRAATKRRLFSPGVLSDRADDDDRVAEAWAALERALAGTILLGPCSDRLARDVGALASVGRSEDVTDWLGALYPPPSGEFIFGTVQPDRLAELLLGPILTQQTDLLGQVGVLADAVEDAYTFLFTLMRTAAHPDYGQIGEQIRDLVASRPDPFGIAAPILAATLPQADSLQNGLIRLGRQDPGAFNGIAFRAVDQLPEISVSGALFSAALTKVITGILRTLVGDSPGVYLPDLAKSLNLLGVRLTQAGQRQAALAAAQESVDTFRQLVQDDPGAYLPDLAMALNNLGNPLTQAGQQQAALAAAQESADTFGQLARDNPGAYLPDLATALNNLGIRLAEAGQRQAAQTAAEQAVTISRQLARDNPDAYLPDLAMALNSLGIRLAETGQRQAAQAAAQEAVTIRSQLARDNPDAYLPDLAMALSNLGIRLAEAGQRQAAQAAAQQAADTFGELARDNPGAYLPGLAMALNLLGIRLVEAGHWQEAQTAAQLAADTFRQLAQDNPGAYLPDLAMALNNLGNALAEALNNVGDALAEARLSQAALAATQEAADTFGQLARDNPGAYLPGLAMALNNLGIRLAKAGQRQAAQAAAQEAVTISRQLAQDNPGAYLPDLAASLNNLGDQLAQAGRKGEAVKAWESAIAGFPEQSSRLALTVAYAKYQLRQSDADVRAGTELVVGILATPEVPGPVEADARHLLRGHWRRHKQSVQRAWQAVSSAPMPDWIQLTEHHFDIVIEWSNASTLAESRGYFQSHADQLLAPTTTAVLSELALTNTADLIDQYRALLIAVRERGLDAAYRTLPSITKTLEPWPLYPTQTTPRRTSTSFSENVPSMLENLGADR